MSHPSGPPGSADPLREQVLAAYAAGKPVEAIAGWFAVPVETVQQIVAGQVPPFTAPSRRRRRLWVLVVAAVVLLAGAAVAVLVVSDRRDGEAQTGAAAGVQQNRAKLQAAKDHCAAAESAVEVADGGTTLIFDGRGDEDYAGASTASLACLLGELGAPQAVIAHLDSTSALNGRQEDSWDGFTASWTYHPDNGMNLIIRTP